MKTYYSNYYLNSILIRYATHIFISVSFLIYILERVDKLLLLKIQKINKILHIENN